MIRLSLHQDKEEDKLMEQLVQERYDAGTLTTLIDQGAAKPFHAQPLPEGLDTVLNTIYADRVDINALQEINGVPVRMRIMVGRSDGVPWSWHFVFNLARAEQNGRVVDREKVRDLARQFSASGNRIGVEFVSHPQWSSGDIELHISAMNLPPKDVVRFFEAIFSEAIS